MTHHYNEIIVRMPNWLGDLVMATPVLSSLRKRFPRSRITAMVQENLASVLQQDPSLDEIYAFHRQSGWLHREPRRQVIEALRCGKYDLGVLTTNSFSSAYWFWRGKVGRRIGFQGKGRSWLLTDGISWPKEKEHQVITYQRLLEPLGIPLSEEPPRLYISDEERIAARTWLENEGITPENILIGINPGAAYGSAKCWLPERFRQVTERLLENPAVKVVYFGDQKGLPVVQEICAPLARNVVNLAGRTSIRELMALISQCNIFLTNDSGPMHIASALGKPLVALFGSTDETKTGPYHHEKVIHKQVSCSPCFKRECPIDFPCMKNISVEEVYQELQRLL
jgi:heptosyltransferase-2